MKLPYRKLHGCKNDYIFLDLSSLEDRPKREQIEAAAKKYSDRQNSIGADGIILMMPAADTTKAEIGMRIFNADGSEAEICGNGIRGLTKFFYETKDLKPEVDKPLRIETLAGIRECFVLDHSNPENWTVKVNMGRPSFLPSKIPVDFDDVMILDEEFEVIDKTFRVSCVSIGNPHCVIEVSGLDQFEVEKYGPAIEKHPAFPQGTNVEFVEHKNSNLMQRTWERGSGETQACGSGACAAGVTQIMRRKMQSPVDVYLKGGHLRIEWDGLREVWMTGEAVNDSEGEIEV